MRVVMAARCTVESVVGRYVVGPERVLVVCFADVVSGTERRLLLSSEKWKKDDVTVYGGDAKRTEYEGETWRCGICRFRRLDAVTVGGRHERRWGTLDLSARCSTF